MFQSLDFELVFKDPAPNQTGIFKDSHTFKQGMTIIHGANEKGKSMRAELLRFALWGRKALRCPLNQYKKLNVTVEFTLKDTSYKVHRTKSNSTLYKAGEAVAVGTTPVNDQIERMFGYDMEVFDLANAVLQGQVEALGNLPPARRKSMVDNLIGLGVIDETIKELSEVRKEAKIKLTTLTGNLVKPVPPSQALSLSASEIEEFPAVKEAYLRGEAILNELAGLKITQPTEPVRDYDERLYLKYHTYLNLSTALKQVKVSTKVEDTGWHIQDLVNKHKEAVNYEATKEVTCPTCTTTFNPSGIPKPALSSDAILKLSRAQEAHEVWKLQEGKYIVAKMELDLFLDGDSEEDIVKAYEGSRTYLQNVEAYRRVLALNEQAEKQRVKLEQEQLNLLKYSGDFKKYEKEYNQTLTTQQLVRQYETYKTAYDTQVKQLEVLQTEVDNYDLAIVGLRNLKTSIKSYLVPSLNRVASAYLSQMTDGARNSVVISETFDITVDGQPMEALSGSAKAVANLAIRLALGQALTNSVFSVLIADEIDAAMDKERAEYTARCLRNLTTKINQIIIISHKKLVADNYVELK